MTAMNRDELALFLDTLHRQLETTGNVLDALSAAESALAGSVFRDVAASVRSSVSEGKLVVEALGASAVPFPPTVLLLTEVAEEIGSTKALRLLLNAAAERVRDGSVPMPDDSGADRKTDIVRFWRLLATILDCGVPLLRGLRTLQRERLGDELRTCCDRTCDSIERGGCLSDALRDLPATFSPSVCAMVRAGEAGGVMEVAAGRIADGLAAGTLAIPGLADPARCSAPPHLPWRSLALMLSTGVPCLLAIDTLAEEVHDAQRKDLQEIADHIRTGDMLSEALRRCRRLPPDLCDALARGEQDGSLDTALVELADALDRGELGAAEPGPDAGQDDRQTAATQRSVPPVIRLVDVILYQAVKDGASDVHFEPGEDGMTIRYRIDGVLHDMQPPPTDMQRAVINRLKVLGNLNIAERRLPQDGRIELRVASRRVDMRISTVPTIHGERVVLRVLDRERSDIPLDRIGFSTEDLARVRELCNVSHGLVVVAGPARAGKTALLYAMLSELCNSERAILTVEDPVERPLPGVGQVPVRMGIGLTFPAALRSVLRQAPNVVMIGELRDQETLRIAAQAALAGHLVLAGMPGNTAAESLRRMLDLEIVPHVLNAALEAVIALRLTRLLCTECRTPCDPDPASLPASVAGMVTDDMATADFHTAVGCSACNMTGYRGKTAIYEILTANEGVCRAVAADAGAHALHTAAVEAGMVPLLETGMEKTRVGLTNIDEVLRVAPTVAGSTTRSGARTP